MRPAIKRAATLAWALKWWTWAWPQASGWPWPSELVREHGYVVIPPYDDEQIIAGQATCGLEIVEALPDVDLVVSPVSGGGLLSGVAAAVKQLSPKAKVFGVEPELAGDTAESFRTGKDRHLAGGADQPHHCRRPAHAERGRAQLRPHSGLCGRHHHRDRSRDSRRHARHCGRHAPGSRAQRSGGRRGAALPRAPVAAYRKAVAVVSGGNVDPALLAEVLTESPS
jgi:hypothetical protein